MTGIKDFTHIIGKTVEVAKIAHIDDNELHLLLIFTDGTEVSIAPDVPEESNLAIVVSLP